jgi:hypothetical protein
MGLFAHMPSLATAVGPAAAGCSGDSFVGVVCPDFAAVAAAPAGVGSALDAAAMSLSSESRLHDSAALRSSLSALGLGDSEDGGSGLDRIYAFLDEAQDRSGALESRLESLKESNRLLLVGGARELIEEQNRIDELQREQHTLAEKLARITARNRHLSSIHAASTTGQTHASLQQQQQQQQPLSPHLHPQPPVLRAHTTPPPDR